jgi:hypothetical protein
MPEEKVKLPRSSYEELCKIIQAYGLLTRAGSLDDVAARAGMSKTVISANNLFLSSIGLIEGGKAKAPTPKCTELAAALTHDIPDEIQRQWARVVQENEFLNKMALAVRIRRSMEASSLEAHIAYSAGEAKSSQVMTGARAVIDILRAAGVVKQQDGQLVSAESHVQTTKPESDLDGSTTRIAAPTAPADTGVLHAHGAGPTIHINLRIDAKPSELEGLGAKIRKLLHELGAHNADNNGEPSMTA